MSFDRAHLAAFETEIAALLAKNDTRAPAAVAFYGSSSIRLWPGLAREFPDSLNLGFGGSTLFACAHFFERIVAPFQPRALVVYAGDNDLTLGASPEDVWESLRCLFNARDQISGEIPLAFLSLKPSPARLELDAPIRKANEWCAREIWDRGATWVEVFTPMLDSQQKPRSELYAADGLHLSRAGYALWNEILRREVDFLRAY